MRSFPVKRLKDGRAMLNLACGTRMHPEWNNIDFSVYARLRRYPKIVGFLHKVGLISNERFQQFEKVDPNIIVWDLRRGIPFESETFDIVYHSHFLEHIDSDKALRFLGECYRVLKPGGVIRVVVPDLERVVIQYVQGIRKLDIAETDLTSRDQHKQAIKGLFEQMVYVEPPHWKRQRPFVRFLQLKILGDARKAGIAHRWMYDRYSLRFLLGDLGFWHIRQVDAFTSQIVNWHEFGLDVNTDESEHKPGSLYIEAKRP